MFYFLFKFLGKVPKSDSIIAWKISGPGLFRDRYVNISNQDIMSLVIKQVEEKVMNKYRMEMNDILDSCLENFYSVNKILKEANMNIHDNNDINSCVNYYKDLLRKQIDKAQKNYPYLNSNSTVKFTEERLKDVIKLVSLYLTKYHNDNDLSFALEEKKDNQIELLTEEILKNIFGYYIYEPLSESDKVVTLEPVFSSALDSISQKIFNDFQFVDYKTVEKRDLNKDKEEESISLPKIGYYGDIIDNNNISLNLKGLLSKEERDKIFKINNNE